jgi:hypothetical protein
MPNEFPSATRPGSSTSGVPQSRTQ